MKDIRQSKGAFQGLVRVERWGAQNARGGVDGHMTEDSRFDAAIECGTSE